MASGLAGLRAQSPSEKGEAAVEVAKDPAQDAVGKAPLMVEILGASVSAGFIDGAAIGGSDENRTVAMLPLVRNWLRAAGGQARSRADAMMFLDAEKSGASQVERALKSEPTVVLAVDYLFWFGYGYRGEVVDAGGAPDATVDPRLETFEKGLDLLGRFSCPVLVGDLPDMTGAARRMLRPGQIPAPASLSRLNERLLAWAAGRPNVRVFPLARLVAAMKRDGALLPLEEPFQAPPGSMLQTDKLHANRVGMAYLGYMLQEPLRLLLDEPMRARLVEAPFAAFVGFAKAESDLDDLRQDAAAAGAPADSGGKR